MVCKQKILPMETQNKIVVICAPSGSGKTSIYNGAIQALPILSRSTSVASRAPRGEEKDGVDYYFTSISDFQKKIDNGDFAEWEKFYKSKDGEYKYYGTLKSEIERINSLGKIPLLDIDVKGAQSIKKIYGDNALIIFVKAPIEEIKKRLLKRGTESVEDIQVRLDRLPEELTYEDLCDVTIENIDLDKAIENCIQVIREFLGIAT